MSVTQIEAFERAGYKMSANHKRQVEAHYMRAERKVRSIILKAHTKKKGTRPINLRI